MQLSASCYIGAVLATAITLSGFTVSADPKSNAAENIRSMIYLSQAPLRADNHMVASTRSYIERTFGPAGTKLASSESFIGINEDVFYQEWAYCSELKAFRSWKYVFAHGEVAGDPILGLFSVDQDFKVSDTKHGAETRCAPFRSANGWIHYWTGRSGPISDAVNAYGDQRLEIQRSVVPNLIDHLSMKAADTTKSSLETSVAVALLRLMRDYESELEKNSGVDRIISKYREDLNLLTYSIASFIADSGGNLNSSYPFDMDLKVSRLARRVDGIETKIGQLAATDEALKAELALNSKRDAVSSTIFWSYAFTRSASFTNLFR